MDDEERRKRQRESSRRSYQKYREKNIERNRKYRKENKDKHDRAVKNWRLNNPNKIKEMEKRRYWKHKEKRLAYNRQSFIFKNKLIHLPVNPRKGICSKCGKNTHNGEIKKTNIHHKDYVTCMPLACTIELCVKCHNNNHEKKRDESGRFIQEGDAV